MISPLRAVGPAVHEHAHVHDTRGHGGDCTCRACRYDGSVTDLLQLKHAVEGIASGGGDAVAVTPAQDAADPQAAPAGSVARSVERMGDELRTFGEHRRGISVYA